MDIMRILKAAPRKREHAAAKALYTPWGETLDREAVRPEHPRPQAARDDIIMLNGEWECSITEMQAGALLSLEELCKERQLDQTGAIPRYDHTIVVPFSPEAMLSGVNHILMPHEVLWYKRTFFCPPLGGKRVLLHFDGVDWACACMVDGIVVGTHEGAYEPFVFDITDILASHELPDAQQEHAIEHAIEHALEHTFEHTLEHTLELCVIDPTDTGVQLRGKQKLEPGGIWYTPQSGIWKSVWLELVPDVNLDRIVIEPDCATNTVLVGCVAQKSAWVSREALEGREVSLTVYEPTEHFVAPCDRVLDDREPDELKELITQSTLLTKPMIDDALGGYTFGEYALGTLDQTMSFVLDVTLEKPLRWSPEHPWIYPIKITLLDDVVWSYCAFRTVEVKADDGGVMRFYLNGEPYFVRGILDQGYWSDGLMTAPADEAFVYDIRAAKEAGFTMMRKHIKVEDDRWYYHCDRLGMLVWQDVPTGGGSYDMWTVNYKPTLWRRSWKHYRDDTASHQLKLSSHDPAYQAEWVSAATTMVRRLAFHPSIVTWVLFNEGWGQFNAAAMTELIHKEDPTRPLDTTSGWFDQYTGDYHSVHNYFRTHEVYGDDPNALRGYAAQKGGRAFVISEFGGVVYHDPDHSMYTQSYGYDVTESCAAFRKAVANQIAAMGALEHEGLAGFVYTQLSDVEEETNGIVTYDRKVNKLQKRSE